MFADYFVADGENATAKETLREGIGRLVDELPRETLARHERFIRGVILKLDSQDLSRRLGEKLAMK